MNFTAMPRYQMRKNALIKLLNTLPLSPESRLFEIGYGAGEVFELYKKLGILVDGYDFSQMAYEYASQNYIEETVTLLKEKPVPCNQYDIVVACEVLEHIKDDMSALKEWKCYVKPEGKLIISVPAHQKRWGANDIYVGHYRRYERNELAAKLEKIGMTIEKIYTYDFPACLFLDKLRDISCEKKMKEKGRFTKMEELTKASGVEREFGPITLALSNPWIWKGITKFEELFYNTDLGSAYILLASCT